MFREHTNHESLGEHPPELTVIGELLGRLTRIEATLEQLLQQKTIKDWYTTDEAAEILGKAPFTVREWCRNRRVKAAKRDCGRGNAREWVISHEELTRVRNEGLLPPGEY
ncbi:MAG TPA: helix-turn-helix domain-containing protein [Pirellulales bacterium]